MCHDSLHAASAMGEVHIAFSFFFFFWPHALELDFMVYACSVAKALREKWTTTVSVQQTRIVSTNMKCQIRRIMTSKI